MDFSRNVIDLWIHRPDYAYNGIVSHTVECPTCKTRVTYVQNDNPPTHCYLCGQENYKEGDIAL